MNTKEKTCSICGETKPVEEFRKKGAWCKVCSAAYSRKYYKKNQKRILEQMRKRQPEKTKKHLEWANENRDHLREYTRLYQQEYRRGFRRTGLCDTRV